MKKHPKTRNANDSTLRNARASLKRDLELDARLTDMERKIAREFTTLANRVDAIERRQEADSRQKERVEPDNIEGGQQP